MNNRLTTFYSVASLLLIVLTYWAFNTGWERGRANLWGHLTNNAVVVILHSDGRLITSTESYGPPGWDYIKWTAWSMHNTNIVENTGNLTEAERTIDQWLLNTRSESNQTLEIKIITHP